MDEKAQGAIEYLLILAGALLVAALVLGLMASMSGQGKNAANNSVDFVINNIASK